MTDVSRNVIDRRSATTHGLAGAVGLVLGLFGGGLAPRADAPDFDLVTEVSTALDRGQDFWAAQVGAPWRDAKIVLIDAPQATRCGLVGPQSGPVYCRAVERIYVDLTFLRALSDAPLARAYVIAHELGHHVQAVRGVATGRPTVDIELEADCLAGAWVRDDLARGHVASSDVDGALAAAAAAGDDRLGVSPESWTHGSAAQRVDAFSRGLAGGQCWSSS